MVLRSIMWTRTETWLIQSSLIPNSAVHWKNSMTKKWEIHDECQESPFSIFDIFQSEVVCTDDPDRSLTYRKQAEYFCSVEKWEAAVDCYKKAIELDNREDILSICLSRALLNSGQYNEALIIIEQVLNLVIWIDVSAKLKRDLFHSGSSSAWGFDYQGWLFVSTLQVLSDTSSINIQ